ncbi:MAG: DUF4865 family protein [Phyllobacterium sp.]|uniref:DUF4865 family protein n=1 Tax=Phyllobacterium sp. TaxID=1871046 RepID=UPI0030F132D5
MIAMQYSFTLPVDYDMSIIDRRIAEKGPLLDNLPNLKFKAYLTARKSGPNTENLYAPFYVWDNEEGLNDFICGDGFAGLTQSFGWPAVRTWFIWQARMSSDIKSAVIATRELRLTPPHSSLAELRRREGAEVFEDVERNGALASISGFEPTSWTRIRFELWGERDSIPSGGSIEVFDVGHVSFPDAGSPHGD